MYFLGVELHSESILAEKERSKTSTAFGGGLEGTSTPPTESASPAAHSHGSYFVGHPEQIHSQATPLEITLFIFLQQANSRFLLSFSSLQLLQDPKSSPKEKKSLIQMLAGAKLSCSRLVKKYYKGVAHKLILNTPL